MPNSKVAKLSGTKRKASLVSHLTLLFWSMLVLDSLREAMEAQKFMIVLTSNLGLWGNTSRQPSQDDKKHPILNVL